MPAVTPFRATHYRPTTAARSGRGQASRGWQELATDIECDKQPRTGALRESAAGPDPEVTDVGFFPTGAGIRIGDGLAIWPEDEAAEVTNYKVHQAHDWGDPGDVEVELVETGESFT